MLGEDAEIGGLGAWRVGPEVRLEDSVVVGSEEAVGIAGIRVGVRRGDEGAVGRQSLAWGVEGEYQCLALAAVEGFCWRV